MTWLYELFFQILYMSLLAGVVIVAVIFARLLLRRAPKLFSYVLWSVVLFRLLCPVSFATPLSVFGVLERMDRGYMEASVQYGERADDGADVSAAAVPTADAAGAAWKDGNSEVSAQQGSAAAGDKKQADANIPALPIRVAAVLWVIGMAALLLYNGVSFLRLRKRLAGAVCTRRNLYETDQIETPFVLGIVRPRVYLPTALTEQETDYIIMHERTHIRRGDHIVKLLSFLALVLHWFNPLVWLAFILAERDMEMSCDEAVMRHMDEDIRAEYSMSLLALATGRGRIAGAPLAFGENDTKGRVKNIMRYKKPATAVIIVALLAVVLLVVALGSNPKGMDGGVSENQTDATEDPGTEQEVADAAENTQAAEKGQSSENSARAEAFAKRWAEAFCDRDGAAIASMSSDRLAENFASEELLSGEDGSYSFGWSSPWPWSADVDSSVVKVTDSGAVILYYAEVSDPHVTVWREELTFSEEDGNYVVNTEALAFYDAICTGEEYEDAYPDGITGTRMDYLSNGLGEFLNENAKSIGGTFYENLFEPESAARYLLNLLKSQGKVELNAGEEQADGSIPVKIRFLLDDKSYMVSMIQPYGEDGIWIPQTYGAAAEDGKAAGGSAAAGENNGAADGNAQRELVVRSVSRSLRGIDRYVADGEFDGEPLVFADNCLFRVNTGMSQPKYEVVDFDTFADYISEGEESMNKPCLITYDGEKITEIALESAYYRYGISLSTWVADYDEYEMQKQAVAEAAGADVTAEDIDLLGEYYTLDYSSAVESSRISDISDAEGIEQIEVYTGNTGDGESGYVMVYAADGKTLLHNEFAHTARAGWKSIYLGNSDGQSWLMVLHIEDRDDYGEYNYQVFRLDENGGVERIAGSSFVFGDGYIYDDELFWQWAQELEEYLDNSTLLLSTQDGEVRTEHVSEGNQYNYETLRR